MNADKRYQVVGATHLENDFVDKVDDRIMELIVGSRGERNLTAKMDSRIAEIFVAPSKHARDVYNALWINALGSDYSNEQIVDIATNNQIHHNTSLIADDHMDDDDERRGVPSFHTSDFLTSDFPSEVDALTMSQVIKYTTFPYKAIPGSTIPEEDQNEHMYILADNVMSLVEGQNEDLTGGERLVVDEDSARVEYDGESRSVEDSYYFTVDGKTGSLLKASAETASVAADYEGDLASEHAIELGRVLQITDDILDYDEDADKDHLSDLEESKPTLVVAYGFQDLEDYQRRKLEQVMLADEVEDEELYEVADILEENGVLERTWETAEQHAEEANALVDKAYDQELIENPDYADDLKNLGRMILHRNGA